MLLLYFHKLNEKNQFYVILYLFDIDLFLYIYTIDIHSIIINGKSKF